MINFMAYIDPGSTALIWQILAGVLIAFGVVLGIWWTKITTFFKSVWAKIFGKKKDNKKNDEAAYEISDEPSQQATDENLKTDDEVSDK